MLNTPYEISKIHYHAFVRQMCWHISFVLIFFINFADCRSLFTKWIHTVYNEDANGGEECLTFPPWHQTNVNCAHWTWQTERNKQTPANSDICVRRAVSSTVMWRCLFAFASLFLTLPFAILSITVQKTPSWLHSLFLHHLFFASFIPNHCKMLNHLPPHLS